MKKPTQKQKKIIDIVIMSIEVIAVIIAITISAIVIANPVSSTAEVSKGKTKLLPVLTDSMSGDNEDSFDAGDLVVAETPKDVYSLEVGQIITFQFNKDGSQALNTHRIVEVHKGDDGKALYYITRGDNRKEDETETVFPFKVVAVYKYHLKGVGKAISELQKPTTFLLAIVLPLALLFIYNVFMFIRMIMQWKVAKAKEEAKESVIDEEEIKRQAIEEYKKQQLAEAENAAQADSANSADLVE